MRNTLSLFLAVFLSQLVLFAQSPVIETDATKSIQQSQSPAAPGSSPKAEPVTTVEFAARPLPLREVKLPAGTQLDIESTYTVSSLDLRPGDFLSFRVLIPVQIDGLTVIEKGSLVTGRVVESKRGGHWGKGGKLSWTIQDVVAVDLTRVPLQAQPDLPDGRNGVKGTSHGAEVATKTIVLGALMAPLFPIAPLALMSGFKRGEDAVLPQGKRFIVFVQKETSLKAPTDH